MGLGAELGGLKICPVEFKTSVNMESDDLLVRHGQQSLYLPREQGLEG